MAKSLNFQYQTQQAEKNEQAFLSFREIVHLIQPPDKIRKGFSQQKTLDLDFQNNNGAKRNISDLRKTYIDFVDPCMMSSNSGKKNMKLLNKTLTHNYS